MIAAFVAVDSALVRSNERLDEENRRLYLAVEYRLIDPRYKDKIAVWSPKIESVKTHSAAISSYIQSLRESLIQESGYRSVNGRKEFADDNMDAGERLFVIQKKGAELYTHLKKYREDILNIDPEINKTFRDRLVILSGRFDYSENEQKRFTDSLMSKNPSIAYMALLNQFMNNVKVVENTVSVFCLDHIAHLPAY